MAKEHQIGMDYKEIQTVKNKIQEQEKKFAEITENITNAVTLRNKVRPELDNKTLEQAYVENERFSHSFNSPKVDKNEIKAVTGVAEKKTDVLYSEVLASNFQPTIITYDKYNQKIKQLGNDLTAVVEMSNSVEEDEDYYTLYAKEILTQPGVFSEEQDIHEPIDQTKKLRLNVKGGNVIQLRNGQQIAHYCKKRMLTVLQVYLGDTSIPYLFFQEQPYIFLYFLYNKSEFLRRHGQWPNANLVQPAGGSSELYPKSYKIHENIDKMYETIYYYHPGMNHFAVRANGIYLQDDFKPLPYTVLPNRRYMVDMNANKLISATYAYGRAPISSAKVLQAVNTEMLRLMIRKFRRSVEEPLLNYSNQTYGYDVWMPGAITKVGADGDLKPLNPNQQQGITNGEYAMYDLVEKKVHEFIGAGDTQQAVGDGGKESATKTMLDQKNFLKNMALTFNAIMRGKRNSTKQRILNILENHTDPINRKSIQTSEGKQIRDIYERFTADNMSLPDGRRGTLVSVFTDRQITEEESDQIEEEEDRLEDNNELVRYRFINVKRLFEFMTRFKIIVENKPLEGSEMAKVLFGEKLNQGALMQKIVGSQINKDEAEEEFMRIWDSKNFFQKAPAMNEIIDQAGQERTKVGDQTMEGVETGLPEKPSINQLNSPNA